MIIMGNNYSIEITSVSEFEGIIATLKDSLRRISDNFDVEKNDMKKIDKTDVWSGEVQEKIYSKYSELSECYSPIVESLETYIKFLDNTVASYVAAENTINKNIDSNFDNLNVN